MTGNVADTAAQWELETRLVRGGLDRSANGETSEALFLNSGFVYETAADAEARFKGEQEGFVYSRYGNPTVAMFEERMRLLEGAEACFATGSGMAAVFAALMSQLKTGDRVVASRALFGSCHHILTQILPRFGIESVLVEGTDLNEWADALKPGAAVVFLETPANPTLDLIDLRAVSDLAHAAGARVVVDNVFATPVLQRPMDHGVDIVVYSATKHIDGQGRVLGGAVLGSKDFVDNTLMPFLRHTGPALSPFNAWVLLKGLETLTLRVERMCENAAKVAAHLSAQPGVSRVIWPGADD
ncbi:MAG: aminotransferase class I/II-fold pyridoxal phosphate-dependent enzyme, partial [Minwuia sp.]|nr:aminotransferase class I/II-fold pyridoxal phosphate-dependent enzyme [Minwuia sp.]